MDVPIPAVVTWTPSSSRSFTHTHTTGCHLAITMDTPKNSAFVFIKPHAVTDDVKSLVNERTSASHHTCSLTHTHAHTCTRGRMVTHSSAFQTQFTCAVHHVHSSTVWLCAKVV